MVQERLLDAVGPPEGSVERRHLQHFRAACRNLFAKYSPYAFLFSPRGDYVLRVPPLLRALGQQLHGPLHEQTVQAELSELVIL